MEENHFDCVVLGAGPGGYVAAIRAAELGMKTAIIEREELGGVCLNWGCIPTKALLKSADVYQTIRHAPDFGISAPEPSFNFPEIIARSRRVVTRMTKGVQFLMGKNKIRVIKGSGTLASAHSLSVSSGSEQHELSFEHLIIATGARPRNLPALPVDGERIITYRQALELQAPPQRLLVIGAGAIGVEFAYFFSTFGSSVTVVEVLDRLLPVEDAEISKALERSFQKTGMNLRTSTTVEELRRDGSSVHARLKKSDGSGEEWSGDYCLVAVGLQGNVENLGLEKAGIVPEKSFIPVNDGYQTSAPHIYAIGDVAGPPLLAHVASHEGIIAAEHMAGKSVHALNYRSVPACTYCKPQVASIGFTEQQAVEAGYQVKTGKFPFSASGKAVAAGETEGFVKVVIDSKLEEVLGVHIIHPEATELIGEAAVIRTHEATAASVFETVHAHPTLSEGIMEAMGAALGRPIHI